MPSNTAESEHAVSREARGGYGILILLALFAFCWAIARACLQSLIIDEADGYMGHARSVDAQWYPAAANHVLHTMLMRLSVWLFGLSELTMRLPALLGAAIYIPSAVFLSRMITAWTTLRICVFVGLAYNPFIADYFAAARGYSLALGFLFAAIALFAYLALLREGTIDSSFRKICAVASVFIGCSFSANFSFALVDGVTLLALFLWAAYQEKMWSRLRLAVSCFLPALIVVFVICGSVLVDWRPGQLYWGAQSLREMMSRIAGVSFPALNPEYVNPLLAAGLFGSREMLFYSALILFMTLTAALTATMIAQRSRPLAPETRNRRNFALALAAVLLTTLAAHWFAFHLFGLRLPLERTALFLPPLLTLALGALVTVHFEQGPLSRILARLGSAVLILWAVYFAGCLRLDRFGEWRYNADMKQVYWVLTDLNKRCGSTDFFTTWQYPGVLNFYRYRYHNTALPEFVAAPPPEPFPEGRTVYVVYYPDAKEFIESQRLSLLYRGDVSDVAVAVRGCQ